MFNDRRRGAGFWSGCFKFHNIICDGDRTDWTRPRTGGLKQGGTYWYYYRLNDHHEAYDDSRPWTTYCPLLPGQELNVLDVPIEMVDPPVRARSASADVASVLASLASTQTLDPDDKYAALQPEPPSKVHLRCISDVALNRTYGEVAAPDTVPVSPRAPVSASHRRIRSDESRPSKRAKLGRPVTRDSYCSARSCHFTQSEESIHYVPVMDDPVDIVKSPRPVSAHFMASNPILPQKSDTYSERPVTRSGPDSRSSFESDIPEYYTSHCHKDEADRHSVHSDPASCAPRSLQNVQFNSAGGSADKQSDGSHTGFYQQQTHQQQDDRRPRSEISAVSALSGSSSASNDSEPFQPDQDALTAPSESSPQSDTGAFEIWSPSFSAATISTGGLNTPFRLSAHYSRNSTAYVHDDDSLENITNKLRSLETSPQTNTSKSVPRTMLELPRLGGELSMAEAIFDELGYLGASIS